MFEGGGELAAPDFPLGVPEREWPVENVVTVRSCAVGAIRAPDAGGGVGLDPTLVEFFKVRLERLFGEDGGGGDSELGIAIFEESAIGVEEDSLDDMRFERRTIVRGAG